MLIQSSFGLTTEGSKSHNCRYGFSFEISQQRNWAYQQALVSSIIPLSPASFSKLQINDIIETINGIAAHKLTAEEIRALLFDNTKESLRMEVTNLGYKSKEILLQQDCKKSNSINESELAEAYSFYSLENTSTRSFVCPFKTSFHEDVNLLAYSSFGFSPVDESNTKLENYINLQIKSELEKKGMTYIERNPDLLINTYYSYKKNPNYVGNSNADRFPTEYRFNIHSNKMEKLPIYFNPLINSKEAEFILNLGVRLVDKKKSSANRLFVVWECEANELLQSNLSLENYSLVHIPLMFMQYPFAKTKETAQFKYTKKRYNFTGISYNIDNLREINDVDKMSPAYKSRLQAGDIVQKINGLKMNDNLKDASNAYKQFIFQTIMLRDYNVKFTNTEGFTNCMYWDKLKYSKIADAFQRQEYKTEFSYLYFFEPYINPSGTNILSFQIKRDKSVMEVSLSPAIRIEESLETY
ncbi:hypothetical protein AwDysgo_04680 [Bacteroidales bacterium]|nr:hypothetical protein AwDysgo_04680 [Bacteroidales bacterium]